MSDLQHISMILPAVAGRIMQAYIARKDLETNTNKRSRECPSTDTSAE